MYVSLFSDSAVFGAPLEVAIQRSVLGTDQLELPTVFRQCIDFLEENGKCEYTTPLPVDRPCWYVPRAKCLPLDPFLPVFGWVNVGQDLTYVSILSGAGAHIHRLECSFVKALYCKISIVTTYFFPFVTYIHKLCLFVSVCLCLL